MVNNVRKHNQIQSTSVLAAIHRLIRFIVLIFTIFYCTTILLDGGTLLFCREYRRKKVETKCTDVTPKQKKKSLLWWRKKEKNCIDYTPKPLENYLEFSCRNSVHVLKKLRKFLKKGLSLEQNRFLKKLAHQATIFSMQNPSKEDEEKKITTENQIPTEILLAEPPKIIKKQKIFDKLSHQWTNFHQLRRDKKEQLRELKSREDYVGSEDENRTTEKQISNEIVLAEPPKIIKKRNIFNKLAHQWTKFRHQRRDNNEKQRELKTRDDSFGVIDFTSHQKELILELSSRILQDDSVESRLKNVYWGGDKAVEWWAPSMNKIDLPHGNLLLGSYLKIMKWPDDLQTNFPFKMCHNKFCTGEVAFFHTLEFREKYQPWLVTSSMIIENQNGFVYVHGHDVSESYALDRDGPSLVWYRPGFQTPKNYEAYMRSIIHTLEFAVLDSLKRSSLQSGKFHVIIDGTNISLSHIPKLKEARRLIIILQDHFPNCLARLIFVNLSKAGEIFLRMIKPLLTTEVRDKFNIVPNQRQSQIIKELIGENYVPTWIGGMDEYVFDSQSYFEDKNSYFSTDEKAAEYLTTMPYHT